MKYKEAWRAKGLESPANSQWSAQIGNRFVFTIWRDAGMGHTKTRFDIPTRTLYVEDAYDWLDTPSGQSANGKKYRERVRHCIENNILGEVILLSGAALSETDISKVTNADILPQAFYVRWIELGDNGSLRGVLYPQ